MSLKLVAIAAALLISAAAQPPSLFTDVTAASGIPPLEHAEGVCLSDLDGDGLPEMYLPNVKGKDALFKNLGNLRFKEITKQSGISVGGGIGALVHDLDKDGRKDIYVVRGAYPYGQNVLYAGRKDGKFEDVSDKAGIVSKKNGIFCALGDYDLDGDPDIVVANWGRDTLYRNVSIPGRLSFEDASEDAGLEGEGRSWAVLMSDFDSDGRPDLFVGQGGPGSKDRSRLYVNRGGKFVDVTQDSGLVGVSAMGAVSCDFDCDADQDLFVTCFEGPDRLFLNDGRARFTDATAGSGIASSRSVGAAAGCVDGDLLPDLVVGGFAGPVRLYRNLGGGRFDDMGGSAGLGNQTKNEGMVLGDMDGDGDLDLYAASYDGHNALYRNNLGSKLFIKVRPRAGGKEALGARALLYRAGGLGDVKKLLASGECQAGSGFCSQAEAEVLFRLPDNGPYDLRVVFPGGSFVDKHGLGPGEIVIDAPGLQVAHPVIENFGVVEDGVYRGAQPEEAGFKTLRDMGVRYVLNLRSDHDERAAVEAAGMTPLEVPMGMIIGVNDESVRRAVEFMSDPANRPIFVHCRLGQDRTGVVVAMYRIITDGWTLKEAEAEMQSYGFNDMWINLKHVLHKMAGYELNHKDTVQPEKYDDDGSRQNKTGRKNEEAR